MNLHKDFLFWLDSCLAVTPFDALPRGGCEACFLAHNQTNLTVSDAGFAENFETRFGMVKEFPHGDDLPSGWYLTTEGALQAWQKAELPGVQKHHSEVETLFQLRVENRLPRITEAWLKGKYGRGKAETPLLVRFENDPLLGNLCVSQVSSWSPENNPVGLWNQSGWLMATADHLFQIHLGDFSSQDTMSLLRAIVVKNHPPKEPFPLVLEWIFAEEGIDALAVADDCLSKRPRKPGEPRVSYTYAREIIRRARGL